LQRWAAQVSLVGIDLKSMARIFSILLVSFLALATLQLPTFAQDQKVIVTVNDRPITSFDVSARIRLWKMLGQQEDGNGVRKRALNDLINDMAKLEEARKYRIEPTEKDVDERLERVAKGMNTDSKGLPAKMKSNGVSMSSLRTYLAAQIAFGRLLGGKYKAKIEVQEADVDKKFNEIKGQIDGQLRKIRNDPRMQAVTVYQILEITFPVDSEEMLSSRALEAQTYQSRFKGCKSARAAASGIFNVRVGKMVEADGRKIPGQMKSAFSKSGVGRAVGPFRSKSGMQLWGFCGTRKITPKMPTATYPTRDQVKASLLSKQYEAVDRKYSTEMRKGLLIEFRDQSYAQ
jgi:peptidyl-prolyl cis-trans isomerase SurA